MSDKPLRNLSTQNDYVASRVQVHLHRTQIKKKYIIIITRIKDHIHNFISVRISE